MLPLLSVVLSVASSKAGEKARKIAEFVGEKPLARKRLNGFSGAVPLGAAEK